MSAQNSFINFVKANYTSQDEIAGIAQHAITSDNYAIFKVLRQQYPQIIEQKVFSKPENLLNICSFGTGQFLQWALQDQKLVKKIQSAKDATFGNNCLHQAVRYGNLEFLERAAEMKQNNFDFNQKNFSQQTPLHLAIYEGGIKATQVIAKLALLTDLSIRDAQGKLPHEAILQSRLASERLNIYLLRKYSESWAKK